MVGVDLRRRGCM
ncbi:hypothetical protein SAMN05216358_3795 [Rhizobium sp. AN5]|nr:hypothetical protein SAMN05216358_3795 [Rhizobium sp. AN5]